MNTAAFFLGILYCTILSVSAFDSAATDARIRKLVQNGAVVCNDETGKPLVSLNPDRLFVPASIIKVLTAQIALDLLGEEFRFKTECYRDSTGQLIVKGYGDPFLVSDEIRLLAAACKKKVGPTVASLRYDNQFFANDLSVPGTTRSTNPYDALNGALVVNFNTINVGRDSNGTIYSAESETPLTAIASEKASCFAYGTKERINLSSRRDDCERYAGELLVKLFQEQGVTILDTTVQKKMVDSGCSPVVTYNNSRPLSEVLRGLLKYSNNFVANQLFLTMGAREAGAPASMQKGKAVFEAYIRNKLKIGGNELIMVEGSGISRENKVTANVMIRIMEKFRPNVDLLTPKKGHPVKSGTLHEVSNYAGYIKTAKGLRPFVIMLNQKKNNRDAIMRILAALQ